MVVCEPMDADIRSFLTVFHVTDQHGNKITESNTIEHIEKVWSFISFSRALDFELKG